MRIIRTTEQSVTVYDPSKVYGGYTLFAQHTSTDAWLIDMKGRIVHRWKMPTPLGGPVRLLPNGNQIRINKTYTEPTASLGTVGGKLVEVDWEGKERWKHEDAYMHHDFCRLDNGNTLIVRHVSIPAEITAKVKGGIKGSESKDGMWGDSLQEITPDGKVIWEWFGHEHMDTKVDILCPLCPRTTWAYINGIDVFPNGDIVASVRLLNYLIIIDKASKEIKWRWGGAELGHQHNPTVLPNGNILVFDNGLHRLPPKGAPFSTEAYSRVIEVNPRTNKIEWEYTDETKYKFFSAFCASAGRLPNGNTLICESSKGRIFEVTPANEVVWEFVSPLYELHPTLGWTNHMFQAHRYGYEYPGLNTGMLNADRFEFAVCEKEQSVSRDDAESKENISISRRLHMLGY